MANKNSVGRQKKAIKKQVTQTQNISDILRGKKNLDGSIKKTDTTAANTGDLKDFTRLIENGFGGVIPEQFRPKIKKLTDQDLKAKK